MANHIINLFCIYKLALIVKDNSLKPVIVKDLREIVNISVFSGKYNIIMFRYIVMDR